jgi:hypothetical protein
MLMFSDSGHSVWLVAVQGDVDTFWQRAQQSGMVGHEQQQETPVYAKAPKRQR